MSAEKAILYPIVMFDPIPAFWELKRLLTIIRFVRDVNKILITKTIAWVSDKRNGTRALIRSFFVWDSRKNGIIDIEKSIL